jgi:hypothetical protein
MPAPPSKVFRRQRAARRGASYSNAFMVLSISMQNNARQRRERDVTIGSNLYAKKWRMYALWTGHQPVAADDEP